MRTRRLRHRPVLAAVFCLVAGCSATTGVSQHELAVRRARWEARGIADYQYDYLVTGFFINYGGRPIRIEVRHGVVQAATFVATGEPVPGQVSEWPTIDQLFDHAAQAARDGRLRGVRFDPRFDFPAEIDLAGPPDASGSLYATNLQPATWRAAYHVGR
jgi:hypothetical protein